MKKDFAAPILVLTLICLVITAVLAVTNSFTAPKIDADKIERANALRAEVAPNAEGFEEIAFDGFPQSITEAYKTTNNVGYVFTISTSGYGGEIRILCGISPDGKIIACKTMEHSETKGIGTRVTEEGFTDNLAGKDSGLDGISAVSGATISSKAYLGALADAFAAFELVKEAGE